MSDIFDVGVPDEGTPGLEELHDLIGNAFSIQEYIEQQEADLKRMKSELQRIKTGRIPELMAELQIDEVTYKGVNVKMAEFVSGSLPKEPEARDRAIAWLEAHEGGDLIKTSIGLTFGRSEHNEALAIADDLRVRGLEPKVESGVHAMTLAAYVRERMASGEPVDTDVLGVYTGKVAKIAKVKEK